MSTFLSNLPKISTSKPKRLGRGYGSGVGGHTVGRGQKGQKTRSKIPLLFMGTKVKKSLIQRLPKRRGRGKFKSLASENVVINLKDLNRFSEKEVVNHETLAKAGLIKASHNKNVKIKILANGKLNKALSVALPMSQKAQSLIEDAGGKVILEEHE